MISSRRIGFLLLLLGLSVALYFFNNSRETGGFACELPERYDNEELVYVNHALCRMRCRDIDKRLVEEVYRKGELNCKKSGIRNGALRFALEKEDFQGDRIRVIVEDDNDKDQHIIITVIRLGKDDLCECS